jgi:hypothetical protein
VNNHKTVHNVSYNNFRIVKLRQRIQWRFHFPHAVLCDGRDEEGRKGVVVTSRWGLHSMGVSDRICINKEDI